MMTHDEFVEKECHLCGSQRCYGVDYCGKYKTEVLGEEDPMQAVYEVIHNSKSTEVGKNHDSVVRDDYDPYTGKYAFVSPDDDVSDEEYETAAQEAHDNLIRALVEAGSKIHEARELLRRIVNMLYLYGYDEFHGSDTVKKNIIDIKKFLEDTE